MAIRPLLLTTWTAIRRQARASELAFILIAVGTGAIAGLASAAIGALAHMVQRWLFALPPTLRLSGLTTLSWSSLLALPAGGALLAAFSWASRSRTRRLVDIVEANALHGGRMSLPDSLIISVQTVISNGFGASVGLEAAYAQAGGALASFAGKTLNLRRGDMRTLVGAGAGAAIAGAFGAPLTGAFYAFEIVIGAYTPASVAPVVAAALAGTFVAQLCGTQPYLIQEATSVAVETHHYLIYVGLAVICALIGIVMMRAVALVESMTRWARVPTLMRPVIGGAALIPLALLSPQALSAGHGALHADLMLGTSLGFIAVVFAVKSAASIVSLGCGFRGGLFFASLFLGTLVGHLFAGLLQLATGYPVVDPYNAAMVGMAALAVAVIGGPFTMAMLVLEATRNFSLTGAVLAAALVASTLVREVFGYSFSTWRLHLRGETIKSARDIGWVRTLTAGRMMRRETRETDATTTISAFRRRFPLGATSRVVLVDGEGRYAGIVQTAAAYAEGLDGTAAVSSVAINREAALTAELDIVAVMKRFDASGADELAVLDDGRHILGLLSEAFVRRRYGEELDKSQRELFGER